jgi:hypothetical protein
MATQERLEYLLACGHRSAASSCFQCVAEEFLAAGRAVQRSEPALPAAIPRERTIAVACPPPIRRLTAGRRGRQAAMAGPRRRVPAPRTRIQA